MESKKTQMRLETENFLLSVIAQLGYRHREPDRFFDSKRIGLPAKNPSLSEIIVPIQNVTVFTN